MNLLAILKQIFKTKPSLQEFIEAHNPTDVHQVEELERRYHKLNQSSSWYI